MTTAINSRVLLIISFLLIMLLISQFASGKIIYVDDDAVGANDGTSWDNAYIHLHDALSNANGSEKPVEILVAQGIYMPHQGFKSRLSYRTFQLINGVTLKGGYAGVGKPDPNALDVKLYETILSGDLHSDDADTNNHEDWPYDTNRFENSFHIVTSSGNDATAVLDGFTITAGHADDDRAYFDPGSPSLIRGGGMYSVSSSPTVKNCSFIANKATYGGGMYNESGGPTLINCTFTQNHVAGSRRGGTPTGSGGGMHNEFSNPTIIDSNFIGNSSLSSSGTYFGDGGGISNHGSNPILINCTFSRNSEDGMYNNNSSSPILTDCTFCDDSMRNNSSDPNLYGCTFRNGWMYNNNSIPTLKDCFFIDNKSDNGGAMYNQDSSPTLIDCQFVNNLADYDGGAIYSDKGHLILTGCIFSGNRAFRERPGSDRYGRPTGKMVRSGGRGGAIYCSGLGTLTNCTFNGNWAAEGNAFFASRLVINSCILWDGGNELADFNGQMTYCDIQGGWFGEGNFDEDPLFAFPGYWAHVNYLNVIVDPIDPNAVWVNGDYHLKSEGGRYDPNNQIWITDDITSPCIDRGDPNYPIGDEPDSNGGLINIGAYGGTAEASMSPEQLPLLLGKAYNPNPPDGDETSSLYILLSWDAGINAVSHHIYFGTDFDIVSDANMESPEYKGIKELGDESYDPGPLEAETSYFWRIDEVDNQGNMRVGDVWTFTAKPPPPKGRTCFTGNTLVWVDENLITISKVGLNQRVNCVNGNSIIEEVQGHQGTFTCYDVILDSGNCISVADNHYFMAEYGKWLSLHSLRSGTKLKTAKGSVEIVKILKRPKLYTGKVYNIKVAGSDQYMVGKDGVIVRDY